MALLNVNNPGDVVLDQAPEPLPAPIQTVADDIPNMPNLMGTIPVGKQVIAANIAPPISSPPPAAAPAPPQPRFTKMSSTAPIALDPAPVQAPIPTQAGLQKLAPGANIKLDTSAGDYLKMAGKALVRGAVEGGTDVVHAASPFTDRPAQGNISNEEFINDEPHAPSAPIKTDDVSKAINAPIWNGSVRDAAGNMLVKTAHNLGANAPSFGLGIAGAAAGGAAGGPIGAAAGGAAGFGAGSALQEIAPAYQRARADGLDHDAAVDRAIKETIVAGGIGTIAGLVPEVKFFGKSWKLAGTGSDGIAEMVKMARKPVSEALAQVFGVQPAVGAAQQAIDASIENKPLTPAQIAEGYVSNAATGFVLSGLHGVKNMAFPVKEQVGNPTAAPGTATGAGRAQPPIMDAEVVQPPAKLPPPAAGGAEQPPGGGPQPQPAPGGATVEVPVSRDDLAAAIQNGTPLPKSKIITLPDVPIDPALKAQGYTVGNKVQQITADGEVHEGTVASARHGDGEIEVTMVDSMGNLRTLFSSDGPIKAAQAPQAAPPAPAPPAVPTVAAPVPPDVSQPIPPPAPAAPPPVAAPQKPENFYAQMDMAALKNSLDFVNSHGKQNGWNKSSSATKREITAQLDARFPEWQVPARTALANANAEVDTSATEAQKEAGNSRMGHLSVHGIPITIEIPQGGIRSGQDAAGNPWQVTLPASYGYVKRSTGADNEHVDVYVGNHPASPTVYVIDQINPDKQAWDEHKAMISFPSRNDAIQAYQAAFSDGKGAARIGGVTTMTVPQFKAWLRKPVARRTPLAWEKPQEPEGINPAIQKRVDDLINITKKDGNLAADKAFQRMRKKLSAGEQEEVKKAFADAYRKEGLADVPKTEPVATETKPAPQQPKPPAEAAKNEPDQQSAAVAPTDDDIEAAIRKAKPWTYLDDLKKDVAEQTGADWKNKDFGYRVYSINKALGPKLIKEAGWLESTPDVLKSFVGKRVDVLRGVESATGQRVEQARIKENGRGGYLALPDGARTKGYIPNYIRPIESETNKATEGADGSVQQGTVQAGIPDRVSEKVPAPVPKADAGQKPETAPHGEDGRGRGGVPERSVVSDVESQHGQGAGAEGGAGDSLQRDDGVPREPAALRDTFEHLKAASSNIDVVINSFNPSDIKTDAKTFQFKEGGDNSGVTDRLHGVQKWDAVKSGMVIVYEKSNGERFIADGHQRLGLAQRMQSADPNTSIKLYGPLFREAEGYTPEMVRVIAAMKNIAEGTGSAIDAAKVLRVDPKRISELPRNSQLVRQAADMVNLTDKAFSYVINEQVPANQAAIVGHMVKEPSMQDAIMGLLAKVEPDNVTQAEAIVRQAMESGTHTETQNSLFGEEQVISSLYVERSKVMDKALKKLRMERKVFQSLVDNANSIENEGNVLNAATNADRADTDGRATQMVQTLANRKGALSDALTAAARRAADEGKYANATNDFVAAVRSAAKRGDFNGRETGGGGHPPKVADENKARTGIAAEVEKTAQGDQLIIPGAEKKSLQDVANQKANDKLKSSSVQQPANDGLFDVAGRGQKNLFDKSPDDGAMYSLGNKAADRLQSTLLKTANAMRQGKGTGDQILGYLRKQAGVKEEEIAWTGLDDFLKGKTGVTKEDVVNYLKENQVKVEEHTLSDEGDVDSWWNDEGGANEETPYSDLSDSEKRDALARYRDEVGQHSEGGATKFSQHTLPGGENYREVLLTIPVPDTAENLTTRVNQEETDYAGKEMRDIVTPSGRVVATLPTEDVADYIRNENVQGRTSTPAFKSSHFDQPNILAHVRINDRTDADGKKVLFVEEIQSDWAQRGRKEGFKTGADDRASQKLVAKTVGEGVNKYWEVSTEHGDFVTNVQDKGITSEQAIEEAKRRLQDEPQNTARDNRVPAMPFSKSWHEMAFRRVAQMAAQGGYDRLSWTTGEQQADRYDLSKQVDKISIDKFSDEKGTYIVDAYKDGERVVFERDISKEKLAEIVGKEIADKAINNGQKNFEGVDLKVGGEGMKGFYDKIIPQYASKFGKKFGAEVGKTTLPVEYNNGEYVYKGTIPTPEQVKEVHEISKGRGQELTSPITGKKMEYSLTRVAVENPLRKIVKRMDSGESFKDAFAKEGTPEIAEIFGGEATDAKNAESLQVHSMSITPAMRESADAGFELFKQKDANLPVTEATARAGDIQSAINEQMKKQGYTAANVKLFSNPEETGIAGVDKNAEGVYHNGIIYISMHSADPVKVFNHEIIHALKEAGAFTPSEWKTLEAKAPEWRKKYDIDNRYAALDLSDRQLNEEAIAHASQDHKVQGKFRRIFNRASNFIKGVGDVLRGKGFNFKSAEDIFDAVHSGEVSGRESARAGREAIQERVAGTASEFPKYSLGKGKKASLDEARETLASIHGLGRNLTDDLKRASAAILHPQQIATLHKEFTPVYRAVIERFKQREVNIHNLAKSVDAYNKMDEGAKNNVNAALELGRLEGETYKPDDKGEITVKNEGQENAVFSKPDETVKLSPAEAAAYQGVRKAMDDAHDMMLDVVLERFGLLKKGAKTIQDVEKMRAAAIKDGDLNEAGHLGKALKALNEVADSKKSGYTPFKRWGEVGISVKNEEGDLVHFERVELPDNFIQRKGKIGDNKTVQDAVNRLAEKYNKQGYSINTFEMPKFFDDPATVDLREFDKLLAKSDIPAADKEHVREVLQTEMTKRGFSSHFIKAKDTPGYSPDFERAINDYIVKASSYAARVLNERHIEDAVSGITTTGKKNLHDYATKYVDYVNSPDEELAVIRHLGFTWYLAGNISSGLVNATQPLILTAPWFHAKFSHPEIGKAMTKAYADTIKMVDIKKMGRDVFDFSKAPADVRDALIKAYNEGDFMSLATNDAMAISSTSQALRGLDKAKRAALDTVGMTFSVPEKINRIVTFIAAYRLAMKPGAQEKIQQFIKNDELGKSLLHGKNSPEAFAFAYAEHAVFSTQFRVGKYNRPQVGRGFGSLMFQFQSYNMQYLEAMYKLNKVNGGKAKKALGAILLTIIAIAGLKGLPFEDDTQKLIEALFKFFKKRDLDIDTDVREAIIKYTHSPAIAEGLIHGIPSALGVNLSGRLGFGNIIPDTQAGFMGPWFNLLYEKPALVAKDLSEGHYQQALADGLPTALANPLTGYIWTHDGVRTQKGQKVIDASKVSEADRAIKTLGFTPSDVSQKRDEAYAADRANAAVNDLRTSYNNKIARLIVANGKLYDDKGKLLPGATKEQSDQLTGQVQATLDEINRYNKTVPVYQMVIPNRSAIKTHVLKEIEGSESMKPRKQDRMRNEEIKQIYKAD